MPPEASTRALSVCASCGVAAGLVWLGDRCKCLACGAVIRSLTPEPREGVTAANGTLWKEEVWP